MAWIRDDLLSEELAAQVSGREFRCSQAKGKLGRWDRSLVIPDSKGVPDAGTG